MSLLASYKYPIRDITNICGAGKIKANVYEVHSLYYPIKIAELSTYKLMGLQHALELLVETEIVKLNDAALT